MRKFALFFMLALIASAVAILSEPVFAQEMADDVASEEISDEISTAEEAMSAETTDEATGEETTDDSSVGMAETTMLETHTDSPLKQMSMGVDIHQIQCSPEHKLVFKASNWNPACVKESSFQTLLAWGWIANHDPSDEELTKMLADHMTKYPAEQDTETERESEAQMEENMDVDDDASNANGTSTDQPKPQSHTVNLSENMDMGAQ
ncbi:MAG: hypothetical protein HZA84_09110 [Thaumarchaeota archaeon]|nr:hypothetical protein [Nitrososphaerota archaeon]